MSGVPDPSPESREGFVRAILESGAAGRVVVAGPGTGKTFLFEKELEGSTNGHTPLVISFLRTLVEEMEQRLGQKALVRTFHAYCKREFLSHYSDEYPPLRHHYPPIKFILEADLRLLGHDLTAAKLENLMYEASFDGPIETLLNLAEHYSAYGHTDLIARVVQRLRNGGSLPEHGVVIVDEYQDFNPLEREFIEHLGKRSRLLIVGDDDQALYKFKSADPSGIREKYRQEGARFTLPYCSRCTQVIVDATNRIVQRATEQGLLKGRIEKPFVCYTPEKQSDSDAFPKIIHAKCSVQSKKAPYMGMYIEKEILNIAAEDVERSRKNGYPTVLVIGPEPFRSQVDDYLVGKEVPNIMRKNNAPDNVKRYHALPLLAMDDADPLGWRIVAFTAEATDDAVTAFLQQTKQIRDGINSEVVAGTHTVVEAWRRLTTTDAPDEADWRVVEEWAGAPRQEITAYMQNHLESEFESIEEAIEGAGNESTSSPTVLCTSLFGSKGLSAEHVFLVGMNVGHFPRNAEPTDEEVMQMIVAITRTRRCCHLVSCCNLGGSWLKESTFIPWIGDLIQRRTVNKQWFVPGQVR